MNKPEEHPMHIDNARARHEAAQAQPRRVMFPGLFAHLKRGLADNDAADMRVAGFPKSVIDSWTASDD